MTPFILALALLGNQTQADVSPFTGTWDMDLASISPPPPVRFSLQNGLFSRDDWHRPVKADGIAHATPKDEYVDAIAVTVLGLRRVREIDYFKGKPAYSVVYTISADGGTLTRLVTDFTHPDHKPAATSLTYRRIGRSGSRASLTGTWRQVAVSANPEGLSDRLTLEGNHFSEVRSGGGGFDALIDGPLVPVRGDAASARMAVTMPDARTLVEHLSLSGASAGTATITMTLQPDDRTIMVIGVFDSGRKSSRWVMHKH